MEYRVAQMDANADEGGAPPPRAPRTNLLLAATIDGAAAGPVRIRNLSAGGALIEGAALPQVGERLTLRRADLAVGATVAWQTGGRCGVRFDRAISVSQWASGMRATHGQAQVDAAQAAVRSGVSFIASPPASSPAPADSLDRRVAEELGYVARLLATMGDDLADEPTVIHRHPGTLQNFDVAAQILRHLAAVLAADDRGEAIAAIGMDDLRARLLRRAIF